MLVDRRPCDGFVPLQVPREVQVVRADPRVQDQDDHGKHDECRCDQRDDDDCRDAGYQHDHCTLHDGAQLLVYALDILREPIHEPSLRCRVEKAELGTQNAVQ